MNGLQAAVICKFNPGKRAGLHRSPILGVTYPAVHVCRETVVLFIIKK